MSGEYWAGRTTEASSPTSDSRSFGDRSSPLTKFTICIPPSRPRASIGWFRCRRRPFAWIRIERGLWLRCTTFPSSINLVGRLSMHAPLRHACRSASSGSQPERPSATKMHRANFSFAGRGLPAGWRPGRTSRQSASRGARIPWRHHAQPSPSWGRSATAATIRRTPRSSTRTASPVGRPLLAF